MRTTTLAALFAGLVFTGIATAGPFKVGFSNVELTPLPPGVTAYLMTDGPQAQPGNYPDGFDLGLTVRAVYIANATGAPQPVVLVSADLINLCAADSDFARDPSHYDDPNLTRERILISITHTHTAPAACDTSMRVQGTPTMRAGAEYDSSWRVHVRNKLREAIDLAVTQAGEPGSGASLKFARSKFDVGENRRTTSRLDLTGADGTTLANADGYDHTLDVVEIRGDDGARKGVLFFYGMHPVNLSFVDFPQPANATTCSAPCPAAPHTNLRYFHPDSPGFARHQIENATEENDIAIFFQAAGGNVNPTASTCWLYCGARATGIDLGDKVLTMLQQGAPNAIAGTVTASTNTAYNRVWAAPLQTAAGDHRIGGTVREMRGNQTPAISAGQPATNAWGLWADHYCAGVTGNGGGNAPCEKRTDLLLDRSQDMEFQTVTIGNWRVAALSHEPVTSWGLKLRQNWPGQWVTAVGYTNREHNYLPTSAHLDADDTCIATNTCAGYVGYEGFVAQVLNGNPAPWATRATTATAPTGATYDLDAELAHVFKLETPQRVNYANRWHGSEATASSTFDLIRLAYAAINGDRKGIHWSSDPTTGSGWQDGTYDGYPDDIVIDFKTPRTIDEIDVFTAQDAVDVTPPVEPTETMTCLQYGIRDFEVQYWESSRWPARWITIASVTNNDKVWRKFAFPPLTTMKIRVVITDARSHSSRIVEIEAWGNATSRRNVALEANVVAYGSSELDANRPASAAINGDRKGIHWGSDPATGSGWHDATMGDFTDDRLELTFPGPRRINEINVFGVQDVWTNPSTPTETMTCTVVGLIDFQVQYKNGAQWTLVPGGNVTNNNLCWRKFTFVPIETSQIRVVVTNGANYYSRIAELEALTPYDFLSSVVP
jgi:hypothetical protein